MTFELIREFEALIQRDPACRGLVGRGEDYPPLCPGHLAGAAAHLAEHGTHAAIVTGFFVPHGDPAAAETDGPPGSLQLAFALEAAGIRTTIVTDEHCAPAVFAAARAMRYPRETIFAVPADSTAWIDRFFSDGPGAALSHLIAVERVGPSHTPDSICRQNRGDEMLAKFLADVAADFHDRCHNMRGDAIDRHAVGMHRLFELASSLRPDVKTIGIGDGGNEIGMGSIPWDDLRRRLDGKQAARIPCRVSTDWTIVAGTSNWGACALAAATVLLRGCPHVLRDCDARLHEHVIETMVLHGPAVDGVTGRRQATVDGLPFLTYIQPWEGIRRLLGFGK